MACFGRFPEEYEGTGYPMSTITPTLEQLLGQSLQQALEARFDGRQGTAAEHPVMAPVLMAMASESNFQPRGNNGPEKFRNSSPSIVGNGAPRVPKGTYKDPFNHPHTDEFVNRFKESLIALGFSTVTASGIHAWYYTENKSGGRVMGQHRDAFQGVRLAFRHSKSPGKMHLTMHKQDSDSTYNAPKQVLVASFDRDRPSYVMHQDTSGASHFCMTGGHPVIVSHEIFQTGNTIAFFVDCKCPNLVELERFHQYCLDNFAVLQAKLFDE